MSLTLLLSNQVSHRDHQHPRQPQRQIFPPAKLTWSVRAAPFKRAAVGSSTSTLELWTLVSLAATLSPTSGALMSMSLTSTCHLTATLGLLVQPRLATQAATVLAPPQSVREPVWELILGCPSSSSSILWPPLVEQESKVNRASREPPRSRRSSSARATTVTNRDPRSTSPMAHSTYSTTAPLLIRLSQEHSMTIQNTRAVPTLTTAMQLAKVPACTPPSATWAPARGRCTPQ